MGDPNDKKPKETGEMPYFRIESEGESAITPLFGEEPKVEAPEEDLGTMEPVFSRLEPQFESTEPESGSDPAIGIELEAPIQADAQSLDDALNQLQPEIESISKIDHHSNLSDAQVDILKRYVSLKESETRDLKEQLRQHVAFSKKQASEITGLQGKLRGALEQLTRAREHEEKFKIELFQAKEKYTQENDALRADFEQRLQQGKQVAADSAALERKREEWKEKVREDLKRIKLKERELENKYELLKRDTQALLDSKDRHVLELKKKSDALELEMESLEDRVRRSNQILQSIDSKKRRLLETMKLAGALLEKIDQAENAETPVIPIDRKKDGTSG